MCFHPFFFVNFPGALDKQQLSWVILIKIFFFANNSYKLTFFQKNCVFLKKIFLFFFLTFLRVLFAGFISIDCGNTAERNYQDEKTGLTYVSDEDFVDTGLVHTVSKANMQPDLAKRYLTVRSFPNGTRNCYMLRSLTQVANIT